MANDSIENLIDAHGEGNVKKAFWLQDEIRKDGLDGIHFMQKAETEASRYAHLIVYNAVRSEMKKRF